MINNNNCDGNKWSPTLSVHELITNGDGYTKGYHV